MTAPSDPAVQAQFQVALSHHQAGRLAEAETLYRQILLRYPQHAEALHLLGLLAMQVGRPEVAHDLIQQAVVGAPHDATMYSNLAEVRRQLGQREAALAACRRALELDPGLAAAHTNMALLLQGLNRLDEALVHAQQAMALAPEDSVTHRVTGGIYMDTNRLPEAIMCLERAVQCDPKDPLALTNLGICYDRLGQYEKALSWQQRAATLAPSSLEVLTNLGVALARLKRHATALDCFQRALVINPNHADALQNAGSALVELRQFEPALAYGQRVLQLRPQATDGYVLLANANLGLGRFDAALAAMQRVVALNPNGYAYKMLTVVHARRGELELALQTIDQAIGLSPADTALSFDKALLLLLMGRLAEAWPLYEHRLTKAGLAEYLPKLSGPPWRGEPIAGKRLLVFSEQGLGDTVHFVRYVPLLAARGARVLLQVQPELLNLLASVPGAERVIASVDTVPEYDLHVPLLSLPGIFGTTLETIPNQVPYLAVDAAKAAQWKKELAVAPAKLRVGIAWEGGRSQAENFLRSVSLQAFAPLGKLPGVAFYGLQKGPAATQGTHPPAGMDFTDLGPRIVDFADTAAIIANLDLVISVDTSVIHVAGALAKPVWLLLAHYPGHMWMCGRADSPWYPTMRIFRQRAFRDWEGVMAEVAMELRRLAAGQSAMTSGPLASR